MVERILICLGYGFCIIESGHEPGKWVHSILPLKSAGYRNTRCTSWALPHIKRACLLRSAPPSCPASQRPVPTRGGEQEEGCSKQSAVCCLVWLEATRARHGRAASSR